MILWLRTRSNKPLYHQPINWWTHVGLEPTTQGCKPSVIPVSPMAHIDWIGHGDTTVDHPAQKLYFDLYVSFEFSTLTKIGAVDRNRTCLNLDWKSRDSPFASTTAFPFNWSGRRDLNPQHLPWQGSYLPIDILPQKKLDNISCRAF